MASVATGPQKQAEILLESGTNELEVLVFFLGGQPYGVNVAKVREVIQPQPVAASPGQPACVRGMFNLRGGMLPLVDLHRYFNIQPAESDPKKHRIIVTEFNGARAAFAVERVEHIYRMSWDQMRAVPESGGDDHFAITGITEINGQLVLMLDFESVFDHINMQDKLHVERVDNPLGVDRGSQRVWIVEDSKFIRLIMERVLTNSGYVQTRSFDNGLEAWKALQAAVEGGADGEGGEALPHLVITDIEMPQMDGLHLTRRIKSDARLAGREGARLPGAVLLFSSLITDDTRHKGDAVGADEQIAKPDLPRLVEIVDGWVQRVQKRAA